MREELWQRNSKAGAKINFTRNAIWCAVAAFVSVWMLAVIRGIKWETNDDAAIAYLLVRTANGGSLFQHKLLSYFLHALYSAFPGINFWLIHNINVIALGFGISAYVIRRKHNDAVTLISLWALLFAISLFILPNMNYTKTAMIGASGGMMLFFQAFNESEVRHRIIDAAVGVLIILYGISLRTQVLLPVLAFMLALGIAYFIETKKQKIFSPLLLAVFLIALFTNAGNLLMTDSEREFAVYNANRTILSDYRKVLPNYYDEDAVYEQLGLSETDSNLLFSWVTEDTEVFSPQVIKKIAETKRVSYNPGLLASKLYWALWETVQYKDFYPLLIMAAIAALYSVVKKKGYGLLQTALLFGCFGALYVYLAWSGRVVDRVVFGLLWALICCMLMVPADNSISGGNNALGRTIPMLLIAVSVAFSAHSYVQGNTLAVPWRDNPYLNQLRTDVYDVINKDRDNVYILPMSGIPDVSEAFDEWKAGPPDYCDNLFCLGGWEARCPYNTERLQRYGISNPMRSLYENNNVYSCNGWKSDEILEFLHKHYDKSITISDCGKIGSLDIIKYSKKD